MAIKTDAQAELSAVDDATANEMVTAGAVDLVVNEGPNELALEVGIRLRLIRERNGLSQRELAKRAGITNSNISMIEQGLVSPSINSLARVLSGIPMTLAQFFACDPLDVGRVVYAAHDLEEQQLSTADGVLTQTVAADKPERKVDLQRKIFSSGSDTGAEPLRPVGEMSALLVSGELELTVGMQVHHLQAGDAFYLAPQQPHRIRNRGTDQALVITAGAAEAC
jgi:transcriptional regulator with XRE-family HTH domain